MTIEVFGGLEGGLQFQALMPQHLVGGTQLKKQCMILTQGDSVELAKTLAAMYSAWLERKELAQLTVGEAERLFNDLRMRLTTMKLDSNEPVLHTYDRAVAALLSEVNTG